MYLDAQTLFKLIGLLVVIAIVVQGFRITSRNKKDGNGKGESKGNSGGSGSTGSGTTK